MKPCSNENADAGVGSDTAQPTQENRHNNGRGNRAGMVRTDDDNVFLTFGKFLEAGRAYWMIEGIFYQFSAALLSLIGCLA